MYSSKVKDFFGNGSNSRRSSSVLNSSFDSGIISVRPSSSHSKTNGSDFSQMSQCASQELFTQSQQGPSSRRQTQSPTLKFYNNYRSMGPAFGKGGNPAELNNFCRDIDLSQLRSKEKQRDEWERLNTLQLTVNECASKLEALKEGLTVAEELNRDKWETLLGEIDKRLEESTEKIVSIEKVRDKGRKNEAIAKLAKSEARVHQLEKELDELRSSRNQGRSTESLHQIVKDQAATKTSLQQLKTDLNAFKRDFKSVTEKQTTAINQLKKSEEQQWRDISKKWKEMENLFQDLLTQVDKGQLVSNLSTGVARTSKEEQQQEFRVMEHEIAKLRDVIERHNSDKASQRSTQLLSNNNSKSLKRNWPFENNRMKENEWSIFSSTPLTPPPPPQPQRRPLMLPTSPSSSNGSSPSVTVSWFLSRNTTNPAQTAYALRARP